MSNHLFSAIEHGKLNRVHNTSNFPAVSDETLVMELIQRGYAVSQVQEKEKKEEKQAKVIKFPKVG
jgi:hypothetical protein